MPPPQAFIDKFRYNAKRASLVQSRIKALERMAEVGREGGGGVLGRDEAEAAGEAAGGGEGGRRGPCGCRQPT